MRVLLVHPSALMYSEIFLRLEPLGLERVASAVLADGHEVRLVDLQVYSHAELQRELAAFRPEAVGFSLNYLANVPEVVDLAKWIKVAAAGVLRVRAAATACRSWPSRSSSTPTARSTACSRARARSRPALLAALLRPATGRSLRCPGSSPPRGRARRR